MRVLWQRARRVGGGWRGCGPRGGPRGAATRGSLHQDHVVWRVSSAQAVKTAGAYVVPTMVIVRALLDDARAGRLPAWMSAKLAEVGDQSLRGLELMTRQGLKIGFGTDLLGHLHSHQTREFCIRREVQSAVDILRSATSVNAEILMEPLLGRIQPGCRADILIVDGDPIANIEVLAQDGHGLIAIMKDGEFDKRRPC